LFVPATAFSSAFFSAITSNIMASQPSDQSALFLLVQQLQQELQNQRIEIQSLRDTVQHLQIQSQNQPAHRLRLPDPPRFDGKPYSLRTWLPSIRAKLRADQLSGASAFEYVWDRLEQPQQASILHLRQSSDENQSWDPEEIFSYFQRLCHNPREQQEAIQRYSNVRQKDDESLIAYLARFERLSYEAGANKWPDVSRVTSLHRGLRPTLRQPLEESNDSLFSQSYNDYVELLQGLDRRTRRQPASSRNQTNSRQPFPTSQSTQPLPVDDPMVLNTTSFRDSAHTRSSSLSSTTSKSSARLSHRYNNDLCYCCGSKYHWIKDCPESRSNISTKPTTSQPPEPVSPKFNANGKKLTAPSKTLSALRAA
jgi:hypothetical protein